jgi:hypothetical protein
MGIELWATDDLAQIAPITTYLTASIDERELDVGTWSVTVPRDDGTRLAQRWAGATWAGVEAHDTATGWRYGGFVSTITETRDSQEGDTITFTGSDHQALLQDRLEWPDYTDEGAWWETTGGTNVLTSWADYIVGTNAGSSALTYRRIPHLVMATDPATGPSVERAVSGRPCLEALRELFTGRTDYTCRLRLRRIADGTPQLYFAIFARPVSPVVLSAETGTYSKLVAVEAADVATHVISIGSTYVLPALNRLVSGPKINADDWTTRYVETLINRPGITDQDKLNTDAYAYLATLARPRQVEVDGIDVDTEFGHRLDIGWLVDVAVGTSWSAGLVRLPVTRSTLTFRPGDGWRRTVNVGSQPTTGAGAVYEGLASVARRLRYVEYGLGRS